MNTIST